MEHELTFDFFMDIGFSSSLNSVFVTFLIFSLTSKSFKTIEKRGEV